MPEEGSIEHNMEQGKGVVRKEPFKTVGLGDADKDHPEVTGKDPLGKGPGRPSKDESFKVVGKTAEQEQKDGSTKPDK